MESAFCFGLRIILSNVIAFVQKYKFQAQTKIYKIEEWKKTEFSSSEQELLKGFRW